MGRKHREHVRMGITLVSSILLSGCAPGSADPADDGAGSSGTTDSPVTMTTVASDPSGSGDATASTGASADSPDDADDSGSGGSEDESTDTDTVRPGGIPIFVAQGMVGRTTISCDDGQSWVANRSWDLEGDEHVCGSTEPWFCFDDQATCSQVWFDGTCSEGPCDCGHSPGFSKGVAFGNGVFVATWGWGWPGAVATSTNGVDWTTTLNNDTFGGLRFGSDRFVVASRTPFSSSDGLTWEASEEADFQNPAGEILWSVRRFGVSDYDGGRFIAYASGEGVDVLVSSDGGGSWWRPSAFPDDCLTEGPGAYGDIISGNGAILMVDGEGNVCRSTDGGDNWARHSALADPADRIASSGIWNGEEFWFWGWGNRYSSPDGVTWTTTPIDSDNDVGPVARNADGTLVAANNVWLGYDEQKFLRSTDDGLSWDTLADGAFVPGHPIFFIESGYAEPSDACPEQ